MFNVRPALAVALTLGVALTLAIRRLDGPPPKPVDAPPAEFSAIRAREMLNRLLQEQQPHPVGSPANQLVRDRIIIRFRRLGYEVNLQKAHSCNAKGRCADIENIWAVPFGIEGGLVVLAAHYDSVKAGPGASDDGVGVATLLEVARAVNGRGQIGFLVTDGEEAGMLGAEAFIKNRLWLERMRVVINVEDRGTSGPSFLFETSRHNANLIAAAARVLPRPITTSLFPAIYALLPNDTDLTVFKRAGREGVNLAAIGNVEYYHTAEDNLAHVDLRTLQHHGDNALALAREYAQRFPEPAIEDEVFFDVFGYFVVRWRERWTLLILALSAAVVVRAVFAARHARRSTYIGLAAFFGSAILAAIPALILRGMLLMWIIGAAAALLVAYMLRSHDARGLFIGYALGWHIVAIVLAFALPGASYMFLVPAVAMAIGSWLPPTARATLALVAAAIVIFPFALELVTALGATGFAPTAALIAFAATTFVTDVIARKPAA